MKKLVLLIGCVFAFILGATPSTSWSAGTHSKPHGHDKPHADNGHGMSAIGMPGKSSKVDRTISVQMGDNYYKPMKITVKKGETIRFVIKNKGQLVHEFNIGTAAMHAGHQKEMMGMMDKGILEADKINHHMMKMGGGMMHDDPNSVLLEPEKSGEVIWKFTKSQNLEFACNVPGHYEDGMKGNLQIRL